MSEQVPEPVPEYDPGKIAIQSEYETIIKFIRQAEEGPDAWS